MTNAKHALGTQLQMSDGASPPVFTTIASIVSITGPSISADTIDVTNMDSPGGWKEFIAGLIEGGEIGVEAFLVADASQLAQFAQATEDTPANRFKTYRIVFPDDTDSKTATVSTTTWTATAHGWNTVQPVRFFTTGALPAAVIPGRVYFARRLSADTFSIHATPAAALAGTGAISSATGGTGTHSVKSGTKFTFSAMASGFRTSSPNTDAHKLSFTLKVTGEVT